MVTDRPTASLTGQEDWEWNERREGESSSEAPSGSSGGRYGRAGDHDSPTGGRDREAGIEREIRELEAELARAERRYQCVVDRYERLLAQKNRRLNELRERKRGGGRSVPFPSIVPSLSTVIWWRSD